jgi:predicted PurR-regulated permease PerM
MEVRMGKDEGERQAPAGAASARRPGGMTAPFVIGAIVVAGLYFARPVLQPVALATLLSLMLAPAVRWLRHRGLGRAMAVTVTVSLAFVAILGFGAAIGEEMLGLVKDLPQYDSNIAAKIRAVSSFPGGGVLGGAAWVFRDLSRELSGATTGIGAPGEPVPVEIVGHASGLLQVVRNVIGPLVAPVAVSGLVLLFVVMILLQREDLRDRVLRLAGARDLHRTTAAMNEAAERVSRYLLMQLGVGICYGVPVGVGLAVIGIPNALLWGMLGVILRFIPYLGGPMTAVLPVLLAIAVAPGWGILVWTVLLFAGMELVIANLIEPWIYGRTTGLSAVAVVAAAVFWTWLWGLVGLLLATPLTVCLVVLGRYVPHLQFLDVLLGNQPVLSPEESLYQRLLARDPEEATEQAEEFARDKSLAAFFDEVAIPALVLAQIDGDRGVLTERRRAAIAEGFATLLDNLAEQEPGEAALAASEAPPIACIAGRNEIDLAAAWLLQHLLLRRGHRVRVFPPDSMSPFNLDRLPLRGVAVIYLSLLSTTTAARARYLVRRLRRRARRAIVVIGVWGRGGAEFSIEEAVAATAADRVATTLAAAVAEIEAALGDRARPGADKPSELLIARQPA